MSRLVDLSPLKLRILDAIAYRRTATIVEIRQSIEVEAGTPEAARLLVSAYELLVAGLIDRVDGDHFKYVVTPNGRIYLLAFLHVERREHTA